MKKFLITLVMLLGIVTSINAQVMWFKTTAFAAANIYNGTYVWGDWQSSNLNICMNTNQDIVNIYSSTQQIYRIVSDYSTVPDNNGKTISFRFIDQDGDRGTMRLRIQNDGTSQLYIDFNNVAWVYNVVRIQ